MTDWMESGDTVLGVIFNRYRKPSSDPIWEGSNEAAQSIGDADARFVLRAGTRTRASSVPAGTPFCWARPRKSWSAPPPDNSPACGR